MTGPHRSAVRAVLVAALALALLRAATPAARAANGDVAIVLKSFQPTVVTVGVGDTVTWTVQQAIGEAHSVTSGTPGDPDAGKVFNSGIDLLAAGDSFHFQFNAPGVYPFFCQTHPLEMTGQVTVLTGNLSPPAGGTQLPGASGIPSPGASPSAATSVAAASAGQASPPPSTEPAGADLPPVDPLARLAAAAVLAVVLVLLFGSAWLYRRLNR